MWHKGTSSSDGLGRFRFTVGLENAEGIFQLIGVYDTAKRK